MLMSLNTEPPYNPEQVPVLETVMQKSAATPALTVPNGSGCHISGLQLLKMVRRFQLYGLMQDRKPYNALQLKNAYP